MWGRKEDQANGTDTRPAPSQAGTPPRPAPPQPAAAPPQPAAPKPSAPESTASRIGHSIQFKGEIHSDEDFLVEGAVEGSISVPKHSVVIGPKSTVRATIEAHSIVIRGRVQGKINASDRVEIAKTGQLEGDLITRRLEIQDGAVFVGTSAVHGNKEPQRPPVTDSAPQAQTRAQAEKRAEPAPQPRPAKPVPTSPAPTPAPQQRLMAKP